MMKSYYYNLDDAEFFNATGEKIPRCVPELYYQERAVWQIFLRDRENRKRDFDGIVAWSAAVDRDFSSGSAPMCRAVDTDISVDGAGGSVTVRLDANTAEFLAAVDGNIGRTAYFELCGLDAEGGRKLYLCFEIRARMAVDPDPAVAPQVHDTLATKLYTALAISGALVDYPTSSGTRVIADEAIASGGFVNVSGARQIANAVFGSGGTMTSLTVLSGGTFIAGDYRISATSGGGVVVSGSGASVVLSGGEIAASASGNVGVTGGDVLGIGADHVLIGGGMSVELAGIRITVNDRPVATQLVTSTDTSLNVSVSVLSGGTNYVCTSGLSSLIVGSVKKSTEASFIHFSLDSNTANVPVVISGYTFASGRFEGGKEYLVGFFDGMCVVNEVTSGGVLQ